MSRNTTSGFCVSIIPTASLPSLHSPTISTSSSCFNIRRINWRASDSSSATKALILGLLIPRRERELHDPSHSSFRAITNFETMQVAVKLFEPCTHILQTQALALERIVAGHETRPIVCYF